MSSRFGTTCSIQIPTTPSWTKSPL